MKPKNQTKKKYTQLLTILIANFVLSPFLRGNIGELVLSGIFLYTIIVIVKTFSLRPIFFRFFSGIAIAEIKQPVRGSPTENALNMAISFYNKKNKF